MGQPSALVEEVKPVTSPDIFEQARELRRLGREALDQEDYPLAEERFRQAIALTPNEKWAWLWLARTQKRHGDVTASLASAQKALSIEPGWSSASEHIADLLADDGRTDAAVEVLRQVRLGGHYDMVVLWHLLRRLRTMKADAEVAEVAEAMLRIDPTDERALAAGAIVHSRRGHTAYGQADYQTAAEEFRRSIAVVATDPWAWLWLARAQQRLGDREESIASVRQALALRPNWPNAVEHLAGLLEVTGKPEEAIDLLKHLAQSHEQDADVLRRLLWRLRGLQAHAEVARIAGVILRLDPSDEVALAAAALAFVRLGAPVEAERLLEAAAATPGGPKLTGVRVRFYLDDGRSRDAWETLRKDPSYTPEPGILRRMAQLLWRGGHVAEANDAFDLVVASIPDDERLATRRRMIKSETAVLRGEWSRPAITFGQSQPVPGRILHVVGKSLPYDQAGYTIRTQSIARAQRQAGLDAHVVSQFGFPWNLGLEAPVDESVDGVPYHRLAPKDGLPDEAGQRLTQHSLGLAGLVQAVRPALLHAASDFRNAMVALAVGQAASIPVVYEVRGFWEETWLSKRDAESTDAELYRLRRDRELDAMRRSDRIVTLSEGMRAEIVARGIPRDKIAIVPNAVDVETFVPVGRDPQLAAELAIGDDEVVLGYISSLSHYEGVSYLLDAIARLAGNGQPVRGLIVGDGPERQTLVTHAVRLGLADRVTFTGRVPHEDVLRYYGMIDVFVIPRTADRVSQLVTPLKPLEAMATARVVVVSGVDALREMILEGETGLVFQPEDADHLAAVVAPLLTDRTRREALGRAAREWVSANRTWEQNGRRYLELYREMGITDR